MFTIKQNIYVTVRHVFYIYHTKYFTSNFYPIIYNGKKYNNNNTFSLLLLRQYRLEPFRRMYGVDVELHIFETSVDIVK